MQYKAKYSARKCSINYKIQESQTCIMKKPNEDEFVQIQNGLDEYLFSQLKANKYQIKSTERNGVA